MTEYLSIQNLSFCYEGSPSDIFEDVTFQLSPGWTGLAGANGSGKSTLLKLIAGELTGIRGGIISGGNSVYCRQETDHPPQNAAQFDQSCSSDTLKIRRMLGLCDDWADRWPTLSHGERKRYQIAAALSLRPDILLLDEPTNHVDHDTRRILSGALRRFHGIGLLVSHDRELLDNLCHTMLLLESPGITQYRCGYTDMENEIRKSRKHAEKQQKQVRRQIRKVRKQARQQRSLADQAQKKRSKKHIAPRDHDAKSKIDMARLTGRDGLAGQQLKKVQHRLSILENQKAGLTQVKRKNLGIEFQTSSRSHRFPLIITEGQQKLDAVRQLIWPELRIEEDSRIGLTGANGSGKTTLITCLLQQFALIRDEILVIPQEIDTAQSARLVQQIRKADRRTIGQLMTIVSHLDSDPKRVLETDRPSPGETRKLMLAEGILKAPALIIMDEPTNHLDLPSIQCLEEALAQVPAALILVSHDFVFLRKLVTDYWQLRSEKDECIRLQRRGEPD